MDNIRIICASLAEWISCNQPPFIYYAGLWRHLWINNQPAQHIEICFMEKGGIRDLRVGGRSAELPEGHVAIQNVHFGNISPKTEAEGRIWCLILDARSIQKSLPEFARSPLFASSKTCMGSDLALVFSQLQQAASPSRYSPRLQDAERKRCTSQRIGWLQKGLMLQLLALIMEQLPERDGSEPRPEVIRKALKLIHMNYREADICLEDLAQEACLGKAQLGRLFNQHVGISPMVYVQKLRLHEAASLLRQTSCRIDEIARQVGYADPLYFSRLFRTHFGHAPRDYRHLDAPAPI